ncbi:hypothetical protein KEJ35_06500 [Candidatus Bathyarchaeota archaeon]|nr:hypothetical protein [Candidatus Bathyarchaeota archaeon]
MSRISIVALATFILTLSIFSSMCSASRSNPNPQGGVVFTETILSKDKIYDGEDVTLTFAVRNIESSDKLFYIKIYRQEELIYNGKTSPFECVKGETTGRMRIPLPGWIGPGTYTLTVELTSATSDTTLDSKTLMLTVVKLTAGDWASSVSNATWGLNETLPFRVNFTNIGNDDMFDAVLTVIKSNLKISPLSSGNMGRVRSFETKTVTFTLGSLNEKEVKPGTYKITFRLLFNDFRGIAHSQDETLDFKLEKMRLNINLSTTPPNPKYGEEIRFKLKLTDMKGKPLPDEQLNIQVGKATMQNLTDRNGETTYTYRGILDSGEHNIKTIYNGSEYYMNLTKTFRLKIDPLATILIIKTPKILNATVPATLNLTLLDESGRPLKGQKLEILLKTQTEEIPYEKLTEKNGEAYLTLNLTRSGDFQLQANFPGSRNYLKTSNSSTLTLNRASTRLKVHSNQTVLFAGNIAEFEITVRDLLNRPVRNVPVEIRCDDEPSTVSNTDLEGKVKKTVDLKIPMLYKTVRVQAVFNGDDVYAPCSGEIEILNVNPATVFGLAATLTGGTVSTLIYIARKRAAKIMRPLPKTKPVTSKKSPPIHEETLTPLDERVYKYIVEHSGVISWSKASQDLGLSVEEIKEATRRLKEAGRIAPSSE